jgi:hypothetical protein
MALIVEDGTGLTDAESYVSLEFSDAYLASVGATSWAVAIVSAREMALRKATEYVELAYKWRGLRVNSEQALSWPRGRVIRDNIELPTNAIPLELRRAVAQLAVKALTADLMPDVNPDVVTREKVGPLEVEYDKPRNGGLVRYSAIDNLLKELYLSGGAGGSISVTRA